MTKAFQRYIIYSPRTKLGSHLSKSMWNKIEITLVIWKYGSDMYDIQSTLICHLYLI